MVEEKRNGHVRRKVRSKGGKPVDENTSGLHAGEEVEEIELSDDDEAALDAAWSSIQWQKQAAMAQAKSKPAGVKEQFDEDKHPRDDDGKFASKGGEIEKGESKRADHPVVLSHADTMAILSKAKQGGWRNPEDRPFKGNPWNYTAPMMQMEWVQRKANMESGGGWVKPEPFAHIMMSRNSRTVNHSEGQYTGKAHLFLYDHLFGNFIRYKNPKNPNGLFGTPEEAMKVAEAMYRMQVKDGKIKPPEKGDKHYDIVTRRKEEIKGIDGALPDGSNVLPNGQLIPKGNDRCDKCGGLGNLPHFKAIDGGVCYKCDGDGYTPSKEEKKMKESVEDIEVPW